MEEIPLRFLKRDNICTKSIVFNFEIISLSIKRTIHLENFASPQWSPIGCVLSQHIKAFMLETHMAWIWFFEIYAKKEKQKNIKSQKGKHTRTPHFLQSVRCTVTTCIHDSVQVTISDTTVFHCMASMPQKLAYTKYWISIFFFSIRSMNSTIADGVWRQTNSCDILVFAFMNVLKERKKKMSERKNGRGICKGSIQHAQAGVKFTNWNCNIYFILQSRY